MTEERRQYDVVTEGFREELRQLRSELTLRAGEIKDALKETNALGDKRHKDNTENFDKLNKLADRINWGWKVLLGICVVLGSLARFIFMGIEWLREHLK